MYGINFILPSTNFLQCLTVLRNALKSSPNSDINSLWAKTSLGCNVQYDQYRNTKQVLTAIQKDNERRITHELKSQGFFISSILTHAGSKTRSLWPSAPQRMLKNFSTFQVNILTMLLPQGKIYVNGQYLNHLHALSASRLNLSNTLSLAASRILKMAVTLGAIIQFFSILQKHFLVPKLLVSCRSSIFFISKLNHR